MKENVSAIYLKNKVEPQSGTFKLFFFFIFTLENPLRSGTKKKKLRFVEWISQSPGVHIF